MHAKGYTLTYLDNGNIQININHNRMVGVLRLSPCWGETQYGHTYDRGYYIFNSRDDDFSVNGVSLSFGYTTMNVKNRYHDDIHITWSDNPYITHRDDCLKFASQNARRKIINFFVDNYEDIVSSEAYEEAYAYRKREEATNEIRKNEKLLSKCIDTIREYRRQYKEYSK